VSQHERVEAGGPVGLPGGKQDVGDAGEVRDVDPVAVEVEAERFRAAVADGEGGGGFGGIAGPVQLGEPNRTLLRLEVGEDTAGADRASC
jgi:hypothetical protein